MLLIRLLIHVVDGLVLDHLGRSSAKTPSVKDWLLLYPVVHRVVEALVDATIRVLTAPVGIVASFLG